MKHALSELLHEFSDLRGPATKSELVSMYKTLAKIGYLEWGLVRTITFKDVPVMGALGRLMVEQDMMASFDAEELVKVIWAYAKLDTLDEPTVLPLLNQVPSRCR